MIVISNSLTLNFKVLYKENVPMYKEEKVSSMHVQIKNRIEYKIKHDNLYT